MATNTIEHFRYFGHNFPRVDSYFRLPFSLWVDGTLAERYNGGTADGVLIGALTPTALSYYFSDDGGVFTDDTTDINDADAADVTLLPATEEVNDAAYFGHSTYKFTAIKITLSTAGVGDTVVFEYWDGSAWTDLATAHSLLDDSTGFTAGTSTYFITWKVPENWAKTTVNSAEAYWVRARVTAASYTTIPVATQAWLYVAGAGVGPSVPAHGYLTHVGWAAVTVSAANADTVINILNLTRGTATSATLTAALKAGQVAVAAVNGLYFEKGDDLAVQMVDEDGTTEYANVNLTFYFKV